MLLHYMWPNICTSVTPCPSDSLLSTFPKGWMEERVDGRMQWVKKMSKMHAWKKCSKHVCEKSVNKCVREKCPCVSTNVWKSSNKCVREKCQQMCAWKMCGKNAPEWLSKTSVKHNTFARHFFHTFFTRFSNLFSRARAFCNFTFMRKFSHHMLDISMHTYVLDLFFTRTFWTLFHTCILDMFSHPYFWPPCPIPSPSRGDLGLICSVEAFSVHLQTVELLKNPG